MTVGRRVALVVVWVLSLGGVGVLALRGDTRVGRLVVRIDGKWVDVQFSRDRAGGQVTCPGV